MRRFLAFIVLLALPACQTTASPDLERPEADSQQGAVPSNEGNSIVKRKISIVKKQFEYNKIDTPDTVFETPLDIAQYYVGAYPMLVEGRPLVDVKIGRETETAPHLTMLITASGFEVGTVYGEQWRIRIASIAQDKDWRIASAEHRFQCLRADGIPDWSLTPCP